MTRLLLTLLLLCVAGSMSPQTPQYEAVIVDGVRQKPVPSTIPFATDTEVYLYNIGADAFFTEGNAWGTQASVGNKALRMQFYEVGEGVYYLQDWSVVKNDGWYNVFFDSEYAMFVDQNWQQDYYWEVKDNGDKTFQLLASSLNPTYKKETFPGMYVGLDVSVDAGNTALSPFLAPGDGHYIEWGLVDIQAYEAVMAIYNKAQELMGVITEIKALGGDASEVEAVYLTPEATLEDLTQAVRRAKTLQMEAVISHAPDKENVDMTALLTNPYYEDGETGWTVVATPGNGANGHQGNVRPGGSANNQCYEAWNNSSFDIYQEVTGAPVGVYEIEVQGFYRFSRDDYAWNSYLSQSVDYVKPEGVPVYVYMNNNATNFVNVYGDPQQITDETFYSEGSTDYASQVKDGTTYFFPNGMASAAIAFSAGMYKQSAYGLVAKDGDVMRLGVKGNSSQWNDSWVIWDNFKLVYRGFKPDVIQPVLEAEMANVNATYLGMLMGKTEYAAFTTALTNAATAIADNDGEAMFAALNALYNAKDPALASKDIFLAEEVAADTAYLSEQIHYYELQKLSVAVLQAAKVLLAGIQHNQLYDNDEISQLKYDISDMCRRLQESVYVYSSLQDGLTLLNDEANEYRQASIDLPEGVETFLANTQAQYDNGSATDDEVYALLDAISQYRQLLSEYCDPAEWQALKDIYAELGNGEGWNRTWDFETVANSTKLLAGVVTRLGQIVEIDLSNNNLTGTFPVQLLSLSHLEVLSLSSNHLSGNISSVIADYRQQHPTAGATLTHLYISNNEFTGNLGQFAQPLTNLTYLNANVNQLSEVSPMISPDVAYLDLSYQSIDQTIDIDLRNRTVTEALTAQIPSIVTYNHDDQSYADGSSFWCASQDGQWGVYLELWKGEPLQFILDSGWGGVYRGQSGDAVRLTCRYTNSSFNATLTFSDGDTNFDGQIDVLDLQNTINYIFGDYYGCLFNFTAADLWKDDAVNVQDVVRQVALLLSQDVYDDEPDSENQLSKQSLHSPNPARSYPRTSVPPTSESAAFLFCHDGQLVLSTSTPVAAFDVTLRGSTSFNVSRTLQQMGFTCTQQPTANGIRLIAYSLAGATLPVGETLIGTTGGEAVVSRAMLSDKQAMPVSVGISQTTTGMAVLPADRKAAEAYRLTLGRNRAIVIDRNGNKTIQKNTTTTK